MAMLRYAGMNITTYTKELSLEREKYQACTTDWFYLVKHYIS